EQFPAIGARLAISAVGQGVVLAEAFGSLTASNAAGDVVLTIHDAVPKRLHSAVVIGVPRGHSDLRHSRITVDRSNGVADCLILASHGEATLVVIVSIAAAIQQELGEIQIPAIEPLAFVAVDKVGEARQSLFKLLMSLIPALSWRRSDVL